MPLGNLHLHSWALWLVTSQNGSKMVERTCVRVQVLQSIILFLAFQYHLVSLGLSPPNLNLLQYDFVVSYCKMILQDDSERVGTRCVLKTGVWEDESKAKCLLYLCGQFCWLLFYSSMMRRRRGQRWWSRWRTHCSVGFCTPDCRYTSLNRLNDIHSTKIQNKCSINWCRFI